jgi:CCR4-NOT transcription complex subunit 1
MLPFSSLTFSQIRFLLNTSIESDFDSLFQQLRQCIENGVEGGILVLQACLYYLNIDGNEPRNMMLTSFIASVFKYISDNPNFATIFCESLRSASINETFLENLSNVLQLSASEKIQVGLALSESEDLDMRTCGKNYCVAQIEALRSNNVNLDSAEQIRKILVFLSRYDELSNHVDLFTQMLSEVKIKEDSEFDLNTMISSELHESNFLRNLDLFGKNEINGVLEEMDDENNVSDIMKELGYGCTLNNSQCMETVSHFSPLTELTVAKIIGTIIQTSTGLEDGQTTFLTFCSAVGGGNLLDLPPLSSWNVDVLLDSIKQLAPGINWVKVVENMDYEGFCIPDEKAFSLFMSIYKKACQDPFPIFAVCGSVWKNIEGQLSFLKNAVSAPPEIFSFAHSERKLVYTDAVNSHKFGNSNNAWLCLELLEVLCQIFESGYAGVVRSILEFPFNYCPEVLILGIAHINTTSNVLQGEVCSAIFPILFKSAGLINMVHHLWQVNPNFLMRGFIDTLNSDPDRITDFLDLYEDLKILSPILDIIPSCFGIKLAALASVRNLVDLETWLTININTYRDTFIEECVSFIMSIQSPGRYHTGAQWIIYTETSSTFLKVLQAHMGLISSNQIIEEIERLNVAYMDGSGPRKKTPVNDTAESATSDGGYADDVEDEANSYFHQMFSGQLTIDSMIQMLARFKESTDKREQSIFECMIANLFEEYKFFSKYPERQLKIAAVLFGSLIKHQLVTHLTLGIALRAVLDALRKPADSKMFLFGTMSLEQFVDRLIEWPQYCNHILQISHLRATHLDLVTFVERALTRITSSHPELASGSVPESLPAIQPEIPVSSFPSIGPNTNAQQVISTIQAQQRQHISLEDRHKASVPASSLSQSQPSTSTSSISSYMKPVLSPAVQSSVSPSTDSLIPPKPNPQNSVSSTPALAVSTGFVRPARATSSARFGSALNIETLVAAAERRETPIEAPASEIQDKISFIINNLSLPNIEAKAKEIGEFLKEEYYPWFAQYMVMKRASIEPNFHDLYLKFLDKVNSKNLNKEILQATYENCRVLLGSELIKSIAEERSLLKNLGSWLGKLTIGRNLVLRAKEIDPKSLIIEAYEKGLMIAVIPFTSKILEPIQNSMAYKPPNPWTMGILKLLVEIYAMPNLKMNLKFDIEVLLKHLAVDMKDIPPTSLLKDRVREIEGNPDFSTKDVVSSQAQIVPEVKSSIITPLNQVELPLDVSTPSLPSSHSRILAQYAAPLHIPSGSLMEDEKLAALGLTDQLPAQGLLPGQSPYPVTQLSAPTSNIEQQVIVNPKLNTLGLQLHFQSVLPIAMDRAIKEIVSSIVQRSVSIATQTTKELVLKDYAMESDETRIRSAAHLMVASLAGSLAHVTCKEPLRGSISSQLRNSLQGLNIASDLLEHAVQLVTNDNLDLGCALIEQAATEKALQTIDGEIAQQLAIRRKHREGVGSTYFDASLYTQGGGGGHMGVLPEALRPKPGRLSHSQQRVYEDFLRLPWQNQSAQNSNAGPVGPAVSSASGVSLARGYGTSAAQLNPSSSIYSSGIANSAVTNPVAQSLDFVPDESESSLSRPHSASSGHIGMIDDIGQHNFENSNIMSSFSSAPASAPEPHPAEPSVVKDSGAASLPVPPPSSTSERATSTMSEPILTTGDALDMYQIISEKLETLVAGEAKEGEVQAIIAEVPAIILRCISRDEATLAVAQKVFKGLYENASNGAHVSAHLAILAAIRDVSKLVVKELTSWVMYSDEDRKFNKEVTIGLIRNDLLNLAEYNVHMAKLLDAGRNKSATEFAISLVQTLLISDPTIISELHNLVDALAKLAARPGSPESLQQLIEIARNPSAVPLSSLAVGKEDIMTRQSRERKAAGNSAPVREEYSVPESVEPDPAGFRDQVSMFFKEWCRICELPGANDAACAHFVLQLLQSGLLKGDVISDRFFRCLMEISVVHCLSSEGTSSNTHQQIQPLSFLAIDIYASLVNSILKYAPIDQGTNKFAILSKVLQVTVKYIMKDAEETKAAFNPRPYFRLFINWLLDLSSLDPVIDGANYQVLVMMANAFHALQPLKVPAFSFAWLELVSHRSFMPKLLTGNGQKGWPYFQRLLVDLFQFMEPFLRNAELGEPVHLLYKGTLRVLLVLLHDFPEFLCDYHFNFCDVIPPSCIQMRNIILSAFPRNMRLPDPSTPNLKIDLLAEISQSPRILSEVDAVLKAKQMKNDIDEYLKTRIQGSSIISELKQKLLLPPNEAARAGTRYSVPLINSLVLYIGMQAIQQLQSRSPQSMANNSPLAVFLVGAALDIYQALIVDLDTEGRYLFLNAIANQLRYPNNHTHYFSFILLYLFAESHQFAFNIGEQEVIQEQITRVLLERLIVNRPHPWGLLITFIELIKNPRYNFWSRSFTRCAPEIEKLFESVSRSCGGPKPVEDGVVTGGGLSDMH